MFLLLPLAELIDNLHLHFFSGSFLAVLWETIRFHFAEVV